MPPTIRTALVLIYMPMLFVYDRAAVHVIRDFTVTGIWPTQTESEDGSKIGDADMPGCPPELGCAQARQLYIGTFTASTTFRVQWCAIMCHASISAASDQIQFTQGRILTVHGPIRSVLAAR